MKSSLIAGLVVGLGAVLALAGYYPWVDHPRLASKTQVMPNGGRSESFIIRLPADLIAVHGGLDAGIRATPFPNGVAEAEDPFQGRILAEHFKIRDSVGDVIGVASRHVVNTDQGVVSAWSVTLPSRGSLWLSGPGNPGLVQRALTDAGYRAGSEYSGDLRLLFEDEAGSNRSGVLVDGNGEFRALSGEYQESWQVSGITEHGYLRGTIRLDTVTRSRS